LCPSLNELADEPQIGETLKQIKMITLKVTTHKGTEVENVMFEFTAKTKKEVNAEFVKRQGWMYKDKNRTYEYIKK
jgi:hypothetical protein